MHRPLTTIGTPLLVVAALLGATAVGADTASGRHGARPAALAPPPPPPVKDDSPGGGGLWVNNGPETRTTILRLPPPPPVKDDSPGGGGLWVNNGPDAGLVTLVPAG